MGRKVCLSKSVSQHIVPVGMHCKKKTMKLKYYILTIFIFPSCLIAFGQFGKIQGQVNDIRENKGLAFANVWLVGTNLGAATDLNGQFVIDSILPGKYDIKTSIIGYGDTTLTGVKITSDTTVLVLLGLPRPCKYDKHRNNKTCPICGKKNKVVPIAYGLMIGKMNKRNFYYAGCEITSCDPNWFCKRDKYKF